MAFFSKDGMFDLCCFGWSQNHDFIAILVKECKFMIFVGVSKKKKIFI